jgi:FkbM family methyltransferase
MMHFGATTNICGHTFLTRIISPQSVVADLGANRGAFSHALIDRFGCHVFGAEPVTELRENIAKSNRLVLLPVALGGENAPLKLNVFHGRCASMLGQIEQGETADEETVDMVTLAEFRRRIEGQRIDLLKVDIEGAEISLFDSAPDDLLRGIDQITVEFHDFLYPELRDSVERIKRRLGAIGFWKIPFSLDNTDVLFVNKSAAVTTAEIVYVSSVVKYGRGIKRRLDQAFAQSATAQ